MAETIMKKDGVGASTTLPPRVTPSGRGLKARPGAHEKRAARSDLLAKKVIREPSGQSDEEEEESSSQHLCTTSESSPTGRSNSILGVFSLC